jgi:hypothetical protein
MRSPIPNTIMATWGSVPEDIGSIDLAEKINKWWTPDISGAICSIHFTVSETYTPKKHIHFVNLVKARQVSKSCPVCVVIDTEANLFKSATAALVFDSIPIEPVKKAAEQEPEKPKKFTGWKRPRKGDKHWTKWS